MRPNTRLRALEWPKGLNQMNNRNTEKERKNQVHNAIQKYFDHGYMSNRKWVKFLDGLNRALSEAGLISLRGELKLVADSLTVVLHLEVYDSYDEDYFGDHMVSLVDAYIQRKYYYNEIEWVRFTDNIELVEATMLNIGEFEYIKTGEYIQLTGYR